MKLTVNGQECEVREGTTISLYLEGLEVRPERVAVQLNLDIIARDRLSDHFLKEGDRMEIVQMVGGG